MPKSRRTSNHHIGNDERVGDYPDDPLHLMHFPIIFDLICIKRTSGL